MDTLTKTLVRRIDSLEYTEKYNQEQIEKKDTLIAELEKQLVEMAALVGEPPACECGGNCNGDCTVPGLDLI